MADRRPTAAELMTGKARPAGRPGITGSMKHDLGIPLAEPSLAGEGSNQDRGTALPAGTKPVRVTLNIPPELYRQLRKWTDHAADELGAPQVSQQDALRAMLTACTADSSIGLVVIDLLRRDGQG